MSLDSIDAEKPRARRVSVAIVAPPWFELPPRAYGGIESICYLLAEGLTARGHDVTLIGAGARHHADELPGAIARADLIDPTLCRAEAERRFDTPAMVAGYERVYRIVLEGFALGARFSLNGHGLRPWRTWKIAREPGNANHRMRHPGSQARNEQGATSTTGEERRQLHGRQGEGQG